MNTNMDGIGRAIEMVMHEIAMNPPEKVRFDTAYKQVPETDEEALKWLADKPAVAIDLYKLYRTPEAFNMDVQTALYETLKACVSSREQGGSNG